MMCRDITAKIRVNNLPSYNSGRGYMIVRRDHKANLWYYGFQHDLERAKEIAVEIGNGIVLEVSEE